MSPKQKNAPMIKKLETHRQVLKELIEDSRATSNNETEKEALKRITEGRMWLGVRLEELGAFDKE